MENLPFPWKLDAMYGGLKTCFIVMWMVILCLEQGQVLRKGLFDIKLELVMQINDNQNIQNLLSSLSIN
jgi:hypothetical protein